jgi:hypothetical protein
MRKTTYSSDASLICWRRILQDYRELYMTDAISDSKVRKL